MYDGKGGGVIAWCYDSQDAVHVYDMVMASGLFRNVSWGKFQSVLDNMA